MARTKKVEVITEAKPHTIKKFELIEKYVEAWAYKILNYHGNPGYAPASGVIFIDCMSNSGVYKDINGNRVEGTALRVAQCLNNVFANYPNKKAILIFNDLESARAIISNRKLKSCNLVTLRFTIKAKTVMLSSVSWIWIRTRINTTRCFCTIRTMLLSIGTPLRLI